MEISRQEYYSGQPFPSPGNLPNQGIESGSPALQADSLPAKPPGKGSPMAQQVKNPPAVQETQETRVQSLGREDPLEEGMAAHSSILAWEIPRTEETDRLQLEGLQRVGGACTHTAMSTDELNPDFQRQRGPGANPEQPQLRTGRQRETTQGSPSDHDGRPRKGRHALSQTLTAGRRNESMSARRHECS